MNLLKIFHGNGRFLYSSFQNFTNEDIINLLNEHGLKTKEERGNRVFPVTDKSKDVLDVFYKKLKELDIEVKNKTRVNEILTEVDKENKNLKAIGVKLETNESIFGDKIILATGGKSYPLTGSTGDGYILAKKIGHTITEIKPSLVPLCANNTIGEITSLKLCKELQGLSLKNVEIKLLDKQNNKIIYKDFGEMIFTHYGVSGPTILSSSAHLLRYKNERELLKKGKIALNIDLKPALSEEKLDARILRDFEKYKNKECERQEAEKTRVFNNRLGN